MLEPVDISIFFGSIDSFVSSSPLIVHRALHDERTSSPYGAPLVVASGTPCGGVHIPHEIAARKLVESFMRTGFAYISGHRIAPSLLDAVMDVAGRFFHMSLEEKSLATSKDSARRGYSAYSTENFSSLAGRREANDLVEKFRMGPVLRGREEALCNATDSYFTSKEGRVHFFPNSWTGTPDDMEEVLSSYFEEMERVSAAVLRALEIGLGLPERYFVHRMARHTSILGLNFFPEPCPAGEALEREGADTLHLRIAEHTDVSMLTLIAHGGCSRGLEVYVGGEWIEVIPVEGTLVVNIGDCLQDWTHNILRSSVHRVSYCGFSSAGCSEDEDRKMSQERISCAFFATPEHDTEIRPSEVMTAAESVGLTPQLQNHAEGLNNFQIYSDLCDGLTYSKWRQRRIKNAIKALHK
jgi:isopenicillin N synthase-like dioxygenase